MTSLLLPTFPSDQSARQLLATDGDRTASPTPLPSSACQWTAAAGDVKNDTLATVVALFVIVCVSGVTLLIRGPRPPDGLTISCVCVIERVWPLTVQAMTNVTRRKSSPFWSPELPVSCGVQTFAGGVVSIASP